MSDAVRQERCQEVAKSVMELIPAILEGKANAAKLAEALPAIEQIQRVIDAGGDGIENESYLAWLRVAPQNMREMKEGVEAGDADAAFAAFRSAETGLHLLSSGCAGCVGW